MIHTQWSGRVVRPRCFFRGTILVVVRMGHPMGEKVGNESGDRALKLILEAVPQASRWSRRSRRGDENVLPLNGGVRPNCSRWSTVSECSKADSSLEIQSGGETGAGATTSPHG